jgi:drug/metabolite transporter (DMT)-like permease
MQSLWMVLAALLFAVMGACVKLAASRYSIAEIVFFRALIGCLLLVLFVRWQGVSLATRLPGTHLLRGAVGTIALALWFFATSVLPLGTAMTLNYTSSLFLAAFTVVAALLAGRRADWALGAAVVAGFVGIVLVLQPNLGASASQSIGAIAGLVSGVVSALAYGYVIALGRQGEPAWRTVFYFSLSGVGLGFVGILATGWSAHTWTGVGLLIAIGFTATLAQLAMTHAYGAGRALLTANLQYSAIVFAALLGVVLFADRIAPIGWLGIALIIGSGVVATGLAARGRPRGSSPASTLPAAEK